MPGSFVHNILNRESRVCAVWVNGNETLYYRGDAGALNEALRRYAAVKADERRLVLLPGQTQAQSFDKTVIEFNWTFHVPSGIYRAITKNTVLTAYLDAEKPRVAHHQMPAVVEFRDELPYTPLGKLDKKALRG